MRSTSYIRLVFCAAQDRGCGYGQCGSSRLATVAHAGGYGNEWKGHQYWSRAPLRSRFVKLSRWLVPCMPLAPIFVPRLDSSTLRIAAALYSGSEQRIAAAQRRSHHDYGRQHARDQAHRLAPGEQPGSPEPFLWKLGVRGEWGFCDVFG